MRYTVIQSRYFGGNYEIWDSEEHDRIVCVLSREKDAENIAGLLNAMHVEIQEDKYKECIP